MYFLKIYFSDIFFLFIHHVLRKMKTGLWFKFLLFGSQTFFFSLVILHTVYTLICILAFVQMCISMWGCICYCFVQFSVALIIKVTLW